MSCVDACIFAHTVNVFRLRCISVDKSRSQFNLNHNISLASSKQFDQPYPMACSIMINTLIGILCKNEFFFIIEIIAHCKFTVWSSLSCYLYVFSHKQLISAATTTKKKFPLNPTFPAPHSLQKVELHLLVSDGVVHNTQTHKNQQKARKQLGDNSIANSCLLNLN